MNNLPKEYTRHFFLPEDQRLFDYDQIFSVSAMWVELGMENVEATYDLYVRHLPKKRNFMIFAGLDEIIQGILNWTYTDEEVKYLLDNGIITPKCAALMKDYKFKGDVWAMPEGSIFFPAEPVVRITGKIWEVNLMTFFLINALTSNTIFSTKIVRSYLAAEGKYKVVTGPSIRAHGHESGLKFGRAAYMFGAPSNIVPAFSRKFEMPMSGVNTKAYHAFITSFSSELEAMRKATSVFPKISFMIDTYGTKQGIRNFITVAKENQAAGKPLPTGVVIDSGDSVRDFANQATYVRKELDKAGLKEVQITVTGNFEEERISQYVKIGAPADKILVFTELVVPGDDPKLEAVLKLAQYEHDGQTDFAVKLAKGKISYPGEKQVFRKYNEGKIAGDIIGLSNEDLGTKLLQPYIEDGKLLSPMPTLDEIRKFTLEQLKKLPKPMCSVWKLAKYRVETSRSLEDLLEKAKNRAYTKRDNSE
ncbi:MAG: hypothetical protein Q7S80_01180 [bacterium]|nr:hypothetical protein [bacterium]